MQLTGTFFSAVQMKIIRFADEMPAAALIELKAFFFRRLPAGRGGIQSIQKLGRVPFAKSRQQKSALFNKQAAALRKARKILPVEVLPSREEKSDKRVSQLFHLRFLSVVYQHLKPLEFLLQHICDPVASTHMSFGVHPAAAVESYRPFPFLKEDRITFPVPFSRARRWPR